MGISSLANAKLSFSPHATIFSWRPSPRPVGLIFSIAAGQQASYRCLATSGSRFPIFGGTGNISASVIFLSMHAQLFFIDYPNRARLKALARVTARSVDDEPEVIKRFSALNYKANIERVFIAEVEALDWNCPQHITSRFTEADLAPAISIPTNEIDALRAENEALKERLALA